MLSRQSWVKQDQLNRWNHTIFCYDRFYVQNHHSDISNRQSVGQKFTHARSATSKDDDLLAPV